MSEEALLYVIGFIFLLPLTWCSVRWLWVAVCKAAGLTIFEARLYRRENRHVKNPQDKFYTWMLSHAENPKKLKRLFVLYYICFVPDLLCITLAVIGLSTHVFNEFFDHVIFVIIGIPIFIGSVGVIYTRMRN